MIDKYAEKINTAGVLEKADFTYKYYRFILMNSESTKIDIYTFLLRKKNQYH